MDLFSFGEESSSLMEFCEEFIKTEPEIDEFNSNIEFIDTSGVKENVNIQSEINKEKFQSDHNPLEADLLDLNSIERELNENKSDEATTAIDASTEIEISAEMKTEPIHSFSEMDTYSSDDEEEEDEEYTFEMFLENFGVFDDTEEKSGPYKCGYCSSMFVSEEYRRAHERIHLRFKLFRCPHCPYQSSDKTSMNRHINCKVCRKGAKVSGQQSYEDIQPNVGSVAKKSLNQLFVCDFCGKLFQKKYDLEKHRRTHTGEKPYRCKYCPRAFALNEYVRIHERIHTGLKPFFCVNCKFRFNNRSSLHRHIQRRCCTKISSGQIKVKNQFKCSHCPATFSCNYNRLKHERSHTGEKPFKCPKCQFRSADKGTVIRHFKRNSCYKISKPKVFAEKIVAEDDRIGLSEPNHSMVIEDDENDEAEEDVNITIDNKNFDTTLDSGKHQESHIVKVKEKQYQCTFCPIKFSRKEYRRKHERIHTGEKPYKCSKCSYRATEKSSINRHMRRTNACLRWSKLNHSTVLEDGEKEKEDEEMKEQDEDSNFIIVRNQEIETVDTKAQVVGSEDDRIKLSNSNHSVFSEDGEKYEEIADTNILKEIVKEKEKRYQCTFCSKQFSHSGYRTKHERIHTGEKPYKCPKCSFRATSKSSVNRHLRRINACVRYLPKPNHSTVLEHGEKEKEDREMMEQDDDSNFIIVRNQETETVDPKAQVVGSEDDSIKLSNSNHSVVSEDGEEYEEIADTNILKEIVKEKEKRYQCTFCSKQFSHSGYRTKHERIHTGEKPYKCPKCSFRATSKSSVNRHLRRINACVRFLPKPNHSTVLEHGEKEKEDEEMKEQDEDANFIILQNQVIETVDPLSTLRENEFKLEEHPSEITMIDIEGSMENHQQSQSACNEVDSDESNCSLYECEYCDEMFLTSVDRNNHELIHASVKPFKCQYCGKTFTNSFSCQQHIEKFCTNRNPNQGDHTNLHSCRVCTKTFTKKRNLKTHESLHARQQPFKCGHCLKTFSDNSSCITHQNKCRDWVRERDSMSDISDETESIEGNHLDETQQEDNLPSEKRSHSGKKSHPCRYCGRLFSEKGNLIAHERIHTGGKRFQCRNCLTKFTHQSTFIKHQSICKTKNTLLNMAGEVGSKETNPNDTQVDPNERSEEFERGDDFDEALQDDNSNLQLNDQRDMLPVAERNDIVGKRYDCQHCDKSFQTSTNRNNHERIHTGERPFECPYCGITFGSDSSFCRHTRKNCPKRPNRPQISSSFIDEKSDGQTLNSCRFCGKTFSTTSTLENHERSHTGERPFECPYCGIKFGSTCSFSRHTRWICPKRQNCPQTITSPKNKLLDNDIFAVDFEINDSNEALNEDNSDSGLQDESDLVPDQNRHKVNGRKFDCQHCGKSFSSSVNRNNHERIHTGERPFKCPYCGMTFGNDKCFSRHVKWRCPNRSKDENSHKVNGRKFDCQHCGKSFSSSVNRNNHERIHTGERPFKCPYCGTTFGSDSAFCRHVKRRCPNRPKEDLPHSCQYCGKKFSTKGYVTAHERIHTGER